MKQPESLIHRPEKLIYQTCYAPVDLREMLASADSRSRIRRLPAPQLYFGLHQLEDAEIGQLLPHVTEEQWRSVLDLDIWEKDRFDSGHFLNYQRHILAAVDPVARKMIRASSEELWQLLLRKEVRIYRRVSEDQYEGEPGEDEEWWVTPDGHYLLVLPANADKARVLRALLERLYHLLPDQMNNWLELALGRTTMELEEHGYQEKRARTEDLGFQDYYDAIEIYTALTDGKLPSKDREGRDEISLLPMQISSDQTRGWLLLQAIAMQEPRVGQNLLEEVFFVINKLLSADQIPPSSPERVRKGIRKALCGINLGLDCWAAGNPARAAEGIRRYYLQSFFQVGYGRLIDLRRQAQKVHEEHPPEPGTDEDLFLEGLMAPYPRRTVQGTKGIRRRFFRSRQQLNKAVRELEGLGHGA